VPSELKHIVLDCDGVLWQGTNEGYFQCYHRAALEAGLELDFETARQRILVNWGQSALAEIRGMIPDHPHRVAEVAQNYERLVRSDLFLNTASLVAGAREALGELTRKFRLSAITGMNRDNLDDLMRRFELADCFRFRLSTSESDDPRKQKPTGYHLRRLIDSEGLQPHEVLCVGDAAADVAMARSQSAPVVVVLTGHLTRSQARELGVTDILPSVASLPDWLRTRGHSCPTCF
jgi:phosphoglycolate phosphatase-like HAD superfamily hydrolase